MSADRPLLEETNRPKTWEECRVKLGDNQEVCFCRISANGLSVYGTIRTHGLYYPTYDTLEIPRRESFKEHSWNQTLRLNGNLLTYTHRDVARAKAHVARTNHQLLGLDVDDAYKKLGTQRDNERRTSVLKSNGTAGDSEYLFLEPGFFPRADILSTYLEQEIPGWKIEPITIIEALNIGIDPETRVRSWSESQISFDHNQDVVYCRVVPKTGPILFGIVLVRSNYTSELKIPMQALSLAFTVQRLDRQRLYNARAARIANFNYDDLFSSGYATRLNRLTSLYDLITTVQSGNNWTLEPATLSELAALQTA